MSQIDKITVAEELQICNEELVLHRRFFDKLRAWTYEFGAELCPPTHCADTYGEGVRETKGVVSRMLNELVTAKK